MNSMLVLGDRKRAAWLCALALALAAATALPAVRTALGEGGTAPGNPYAWGTDVGWINLAPTGGGVVIYDDHLEGFAWGENVGWVRFGTHTEGGSHTYANDAAGTYGVNVDAEGNLSGYAWGSTIGWIDFAPPAGGVSLTPGRGDLAGYAWGENVGWIGFGSPAVAVPRGDCNADRRVDAGDVSAVILEIFDGDGDDPNDVRGGTFVGHPVGCNANADNAVNAGDLSCAILLIFNGPGACGP